MAKNLPAIQETHVQFLGWEDPPEEGMEPDLVILPGESRGQRSLVGYSPWGHKVGNDWVTKYSEGDELGDGLGGGFDIRLSHEGRYCGPEARKAPALGPWTCLCL